MAITAGQVKEHLGSDYGKRADGTLPDLQPHINRANKMVARVASMAVAQNRLAPDAEERDMIALSLACHFYCKNDRLKTSKSTEGVSASYVQGGSSINAAGEYYKQEAIESDPSGLVNALLNRLFAGSTWLGKTVDEQIDYEDR